MHEIIKNIWIGNYHDALDANLFNRHNISAVANITKNIPFLKKSMDRLHLKVEDDGNKHDYKVMAKRLPEIVAWIDDMLQQNKVVLVHCAAGIQRSACVVAAYLMHSNSKFSVANAVNFVRSRRPIAFSPAVNFKSSLVMYRRYLHNGH